LGRSFSGREIDSALREFAPFCQSERKKDFLAETARALAAFQVAGWFQGRSEFGPRALGNRSILAHPGRKTMVRRINAFIKGREAFRPFAPTVLARSAAEWFEDSAESPFMSQAVRVRPERRGRIPAVVHADGTARLQTIRREENPLFFRLLEEFEGLTGLPLLLNTSFNIHGEPLVEDPRDALRSFLDSDLDLLVLGDRMVHKLPFPAPGTHAGLRPLQEDPDARAEVVSDVRGEPVQVRFLSRGRTFDSDTLELGLFEACTGESTLDKLIEDFQEEYSLPREEILDRLKRLFRKRLIRFRPAARTLSPRRRKLRD
ncbi:MAG: carbamoyltransferase C-terminal domain-containing protein, partial [Planctomycetota bacterium]